MTIVRQDAWTNDEDLVLAEVVLRHIREGSTQLSAFEEVGERLSRTAAACGFRWNSSIRKKYDAAITIAKKQRKNLKKTNLDDQNKDSPIEVATELYVSQEGVPVIQTRPIASISIDDIIEFLINQKHVLATGNQFQEENIQLKEKVAHLTSENEILSRDLSHLQENYELMKQDYKLLIDIMDRAKQFSVSKN